MMASAVCTSALRFSRYRYTGKERDTESGNDYFGARYYASSMGRFLSPDPQYVQERMAGWNVRLLTACYGLRPCFTPGRRSLRQR
jgi:RHS repeat-associated protein